MFAANLPIFLIWLWYAIKARKLTFFTAVNPTIPTGGMWGETKWDILNKIPKSHRPTTILITKDTSFAEILSKIAEAGLQYPLIAKPNIGERGFMVVKLTGEENLLQYTKKFKEDFLIQPFVDLPQELAVMYHRYPDGKPGRVTSICIKETLKVTGDGESSVRTLMNRSLRSKFQIPRFEKDFPAILNVIPGKNEILELEPIGNHCRGTKFLNGNEYIDDELNAIFDNIAKEMKDVYYGRFDMKCHSIESIKKGEPFMVMEYNGIGAEPAHIYDPHYPFIHKYRDILNHWSIIYAIYLMQKQRGVRAISFKEGIKSLKQYFNYMSKVKKD
jgi:hypothetical protein